MAKFIKYSLHPSVYTKLNAIKLCHEQSLIIITDKIPKLVLPLQLHNHAERRIIQYFTPAETFTQPSSLLHKKLLKVAVLCSLSPELTQAGGFLQREMWS